MTNGNIVILCVIFSRSVVNFTFLILVCAITRYVNEQYIRGSQFSSFKDRSCHLMEMAEPPNCPMNSLLFVLAC